VFREKIVDRNDSADERITLKGAADFTMLTTAMVPALTLPSPEAAEGFDLEH